MAGLPEEVKLGPRHHSCCDENGDVGWIREPLLSLGAERCVSANWGTVGMGPTPASCRFPAGSVPPPLCPSATDCPTMARPRKTPSLSGPRSPKSGLGLKLPLDFPPESWNLNSWVLFLLWQEVSTFM